MSIRTWTALSAVAIATFFFNGCSGHTDRPAASDAGTSASVSSPEATAMTAASSTPDAVSAPAAGATGIAAMKTVDPADSTFDVHWKSATKVVSAATIASAYRGALKDGTLRFDAGKAPDLASITAGTVVVFAGLGVRKVVGVQNDGTTLSVATTPAALDDAVQDGHIAWHVPVDFSRVAFEPPPGFHRVVAADDASWERLFFEPAEAAGTAMTFKSEVKDWDVEVTLTPEATNLHVDLDAKKTADGGGYVDLHADGELDDLSNATDIAIANGTTTKVTDENTLHGKVKFTWSVAFDKEHGGEDIKTLNEADVEKLPLHFTYPFVVGVVPMEIKLTSGFAFSPFFKSKTTVAQGSYETSFGGTATAEQTETSDGSTSGATSSDENLEGTGDIDSYGGTLSIAPLGLSTTVMLPKVQLSFGIPDLLFDDALGESSAGPYVALMTQANFVATGPVSIAACERRELNVIGIAGADATLFGKSLARSPQKTIFTKGYTMVVPSNIKLCQSDDK